MTCQSDPPIDVAVIGAGPAGCSAALLLARGGARVVLIEKASLPRYKTCGGGLLSRARRLLPASVSKTVERECYAAELNFIQKGLHFVTRRSDPIIAMTMRAELDYLLATEAQMMGARLVEGCSVTGITELAHGVELQTATGPVHAKFVVAADGANSLVARLSGWNEARNLIPALEYEVFVNDEDFERLRERARFDFGVAPEGYAWVFPKRAHLSIGVLSMRRGRVNLAGVLNNYLRHLGIKETKKIERHGYVIPTAPRKGQLARGRVLLAGDAAGLVDPVTAEGITFAVQSGQLAAQALIDCVFDPVSVGLRYQSLMAKCILHELKAGRVLAWLLYKQPRLAAWFFGKHGEALSEFVTDVVMGHKTYRDALRQPGSYLRFLKVWKTSMTHREW